MKQKVNLFLVGAMKAGTTSLVDILGTHTDIYVPPIKEPHYFVDALPKNIYEPSKFYSEAYYFENNFPDPLHIAQLKNEKQYQKLYSQAGNEKYLLDASTAYLHAPEAEERIYDYNPQAKILIVLRDPMQRAFSHFKMDLALGRVTGSFENALQNELLAYKEKTLTWNSYLGMSFYSEQVSKFEQKFEDVLVIRLSDLIKEQATTLERLAKFLSIESFSATRTAHKNQSRELRFQKVFYVLKRLGLKDYFSKVFSKSQRQKMFSLVSKSAKKETPISEEVKNQLNEIFSHESSVYSHFKNMKE